jgi:hypothetical protein
MCLGRGPALVRLLPGQPLRVVAGIILAVRLGIAAYG